MIYYDGCNNLLAIDKNSLKLFDCQDIEEFNDKIGDVSNLFLKEDGYFYRFDYFEWVDFIDFSKDSTNKVLIPKKNGETVEAKITISEIFPINNVVNINIIYGIEFTNIKKINLQKIRERKNIKEKFILKSLLSEEKKLNKACLMQNLGLEEEFFEELLRDFKEENKKYILQIENKISENNYKSILNIISTLTSMAQNLKFDDLIPILRNMEKNIKNQNYADMKNFFDIYKEEIKLFNHI